MNEWALISPSDVPGFLSDRFTANGARFEVPGNSLRLAAADGAASLDDARALSLASQYVRVLGDALTRRIWLVTWSDFLALPVGRSLYRGFTQDDQRRVQAAQRRARNAMLGDPVLKRAYDYIDDARNEPRVASFGLYKAIETIEAVFGEEAKTIAALGIGKELRAVKRSANDPMLDQRHSLDDPTARATPIDIEAMIEQTLAVVHAYEGYAARAVNRGP